MNSKNTGGFAFPLELSDGYFQAGMTLRQYAAICGNMLQLWHFKEFLQIQKEPAMLKNLLEMLAILQI